MRTIESKQPKKKTASSPKYLSWDAYVQAKVERANERLNRLDLTKVTGKQKELP